MIGSLCEQLLRIPHISGISKHFFMRLNGWFVYMDIYPL